MLKILINSFFAINSRRITLSFCRHLSTTRFLCHNKDYGISIDEPKVKLFLENLRQEFYNQQNQNEDTNNNNSNYGQEQAKKLKKMTKLIAAYEERNTVIQNLHSLKDLDNEKDEDMRNLIKEEKEVYGNLIQQLEQKILEELFNYDETDICNSVMFEINAGVGGQEAMLFASELFEMYINFINYKNWNYEIINADYTDLGGLRHASLIVYGTDAIKYLKHEAGVHRVQRVPTTEKSGRMHTSTVSVAVIPRNDDTDITLHDKDLRIETKKASGAGGQHVNTTESAVRITHIPTEISVEVQEDRSQIKNREIALKRLKARIWQKEYELKEANADATRKSQIGQRNRNEKIRTYNFTQDRITDHRIKDGTFKNLKEFLNGEDDLEYLIDQLSKFERRENVIKLISDNQKADKIN